MQEPVLCIEHRRVKINLFYLQCLSIICNHLLLYNSCDFLDVDTRITFALVLLPTVLTESSVAILETI